MRNSISVALVVVSIIVAVTSTFCGGITEAHAAGGFVAVNGGFGLLLALFLGLVGIAIKPSNEVRSSVVSVVAPTTNWPVYQHEADTYFDGYIPGEEGFDARQVQTWADVMPISTVRGMQEPEELPFVSQSFLRNGSQCTSTMYLRKG